MNNIIGGFEGIFPMDVDVFHFQLEHELKACDPKAPLDIRALPGLFRSYMCSSNEILVVDSLVEYSNEEIEEDVIGKQGIIFGFNGRGLLGRYVFHENVDRNELECVKRFEIVGSFNLDSIVVPSSPFVQLRIVQEKSGIWILGDVCTTIDDAMFLLKTLSGVGLDFIAHKSILGYLPGMEYED